MRGKVFFTPFQVGEQGVGVIEREVAGDVVGARAIQADRRNAAAGVGEDVDAPLFAPTCGGFDSVGRLGSGRVVEELAGFEVVAAGFALARQDDFEGGGEDVFGGWRVGCRVEQGGQGWVGGERVGAGTVEVEGTLIFGGDCGVVGPGVGEGGRGKDGFVTKGDVARVGGAKELDQHEGALRGAIHLCRGRLAGGGRGNESHDAAPGFSEPPGDFVGGAVPCRGGDLGEFGAEEEDAGKIRAGIGEDIRAVIRVPAEGGFDAMRGLRRAHVVDEAFLIEVVGDGMRTQQGDFTGPLAKAKERTGPGVGGHGGGCAVRVCVEDIEGGGDGNDNAHKEKEQEQPRCGGSECAGQPRR